MMMITTTITIKLKNISSDFFKWARKQYILNRLKEIELPIKETLP